MDIEYVEVAFRPGLNQVYCAQKTSKDYCRAQSGKAFYAGSETFSNTSSTQPQMVCIH